MISDTAVQVVCWQLFERSATKAISFASDNVKRDCLRTNKRYTWQVKCCSTDKRWQHAPVFICHWNGVRLHYRISVFFRAGSWMHGALYYIDGFRHPLESGSLQSNSLCIATWPQFERSQHHSAAVAQPATACLYGAWHVAPMYSCNTHKPECVQTCKLSEETFQFNETRSCRSPQVCCNFPLIPRQVVDRWSAFRKPVAYYSTVTIVVPSCYQIK